MPYLIKLFSDKVFDKNDLHEAINKYLQSFPDLVIDVPKLTLNFGTILANLLAQQVIDGSQLTLVSETQKDEEPMVEEYFRLMSIILLCLYKNNNFSFEKLAEIYEK